MARRPNWRRIKSHRNYTVEEAARALGHCRGTIRRWLKNGLPAIRDQRPALILGTDLIDYLKARRAPKQTCKLDQCFCLRCRAPRRPAFAAVEYRPVTSTSGNLRALCEVCSAVMHKRVSAARLQVLRATLDVTVTRPPEHRKQAL